MGRIRLDFAEDAFTYTTDLVVRSTDVNAAGHTGNDALVSLISDARLMFLAHADLTGDVAEDASPGKVGVIVTDLAVVYQAQTRQWDTLRFEMGLADVNTYGADVVTRVTRPADGTAVALAKSGFVFFEYTTGKVIAAPAGFGELDG